MGDKFVFADVLEIRNGKNQRKVENPQGRYPIFGSGGVMGYADDFICDAETVVIGRKGNINNPIFVNEPFWNVDTAFGLVANRQIIVPKFLYYFCVNYDFEKLNTTVTIPSLTKANLLQINIDVPELEQQEVIVKTLDKISDLIALRQAELNALDKLTKARFIEMFGDPLKNDKGFELRKGVDCFKLSNGKFVPENKRFSTGIPAYGGNGISWYTDDVLFEGNTIVVGRVGFQSGNVHLAMGPLWITDNAMYISQFNDRRYNLVFLTALMEHIDFKRYQDAGDLKKITQKPFMEMSFISPPIELQEQYTNFVQATDKSKLAIQKSIDELQTLFDSLMQEYFE